VHSNFNHGKYFSTRIFAQKIEIFVIITLEHKFGNANYLVLHLFVKVHQSLLSHTMSRVKTIVYIGTTPGSE